MRPARKIDAPGSGVRPAAQAAGQEDAGGELAANVARVLDTLGTLGA